MMNRLLIFIYIILLILIGTVMVAFATGTLDVSYDGNTFDVKINGETIPRKAGYGDFFIDQGGYLQIPTRWFLEFFGADVEWDNDIKTAYIRANGNIVEFTEGSYTYKINGKSAMMSTKPFTKEGRLYVPLENAAEALGYSVNFTFGFADEDNPEEENTDSSDNNTDNQEQNQENNNSNNPSEENNSGEGNQNNSQNPSDSNNSDNSNGSSSDSSQNDNSGSGDNQTSDNSSSDQGSQNNTGNDSSGSGSGSDSSSTGSNNQNNEQTNNQDNENQSDNIDGTVGSGNNNGSGSSNGTGGVSGSGGISKEAISDDLSLWQDDPEEIERLNKAAEEKVNEFMDKLRPIFLFLYGILFLTSIVVIIVLFCKLPYLSRFPIERRKTMENIFQFVGVAVFSGGIFTFFGPYWGMYDDFVNNFMQYSQSWENVINPIFSSYKDFVSGIFGLASLTMLVLFIKSFLQLGISASNPEARREAMTGILLNGIGIAGLGGVAVWIGLFWNML